MKFLIWVTLVVVFLLSAQTEAAAPAGGGGGALAQECNKEFQKVTICLDFASGKKAEPTKQCCDSVESIKEKDPKCLCFIIQQAKNGGQAMKDLGVQEDKLLQLPSACHLRNASISNCPLLLGIPPSSPDAAIFSRNATSGSPPAGMASPSTSTPTSEQKGGSASTPDSHVAIAVALPLVAISAFLISAIPVLRLA